MPKAVCVRTCGYTGRLFEEEFLGTWRGQWDGGYITYSRAMNLVKSSQPWDPTDPDPRHANNLHALVADRLGIEDYAMLKLYTAIGSPMDRFHGVDGFFEFMGQIVTIDLTINSRKDYYKADVIITESDVEQGLSSAAERIAKFIART